MPLDHFNPYAKGLRSNKE